MALVIRYFSTAGAGAEDGTTWANRAPLFSAGAWSTIITGFNFSGSDSLEARIGPGSYTCGARLQASSFANPPDGKRYLMLHGCNSSGDLLEPPDPDWVSAQPAWDDSSLPVIATTTNIVTISLFAAVRLLKFTASGRTGGPMLQDTGLSEIDWCSFVNSASNATASVLESQTRVFNCLINASGTNFDYLVAVPNTALFRNCRAWSGASSGSRRGFSYYGSTSGAVIDKCTIYGVGGDAIGSTATNVGQFFQVVNCTIHGVGGTGIKPNSTASQTGLHVFRNNIIVGCGAYGIDAQSQASVLATRNRLRNNTSGNFNGLGNYPENLGNITASDTDTDEFVNVAGGDFRLKTTATYWGVGIGAGDEPAAGGGGAIVNQGLHSIESGINA
jgi:hypothetical protein